MAHDRLFDRPPVVVAQSRRRLLGGVAVGCVLIAWTLWALPEVSNVARIFVGLFLVVGVVMLAGGVAGLFTPARLILEPAGLTYETLFARRHWTWSEVDVFRVVDDGEGGKTIDFALRGLVSASHRSEESLPTDWSMPVDELCGTLNAARARWG